MPDASPTNGTANYDSPWKDAIQIFLRPFLELCFPHVEAGVDWSREPEFMEQELRELMPDSAVGPQRVDQLIKVWRLDGEEQRVLLHVEVQAQVDKNLALRLYQYHSRLTGQFGGPVVTLCVLADSSRGFRPMVYEWDFWRCRVTFEFPTCKLLDFNDADLEASLNPIAVVIRAHRAAQSTRKDVEKRKFAKAMLVYGLYEKRIAETDFYNLFRLINWLLKLPNAQELDFRRELSEYQQTNAMPYITNYDRIVREEGLEEGRELGREEGRELGRQDGVRAAILQNVERHFGSLPTDLAERLEAITDDHILQRVFDLTWDAPTLEDFMARLAELQQG